MRKIASPQDPSQIEIEVSQAYLGRQSAPARLLHPAVDVFHDSDLRPLRLANGELRRLKLHLRAVGLLKTRSLPGTFALQGDNIEAALSNAPLPPAHTSLAKVALTTLRQDSGRLRALRTAKEHLDQSLAAEPQAAPQLATLRIALQQEMQIPAPLVETLRDMQRVLNEPQAMPFDLSTLPQRGR